MKAVLISIQPKWVEKIVKGEKTIEVRKTRPKLEVPFKCYIYETIEKVKEIVEEYDSNFKLLRRKRTTKQWGGKVIGEFVCDRIDEYKCEFVDDDCLETVHLIDREDCDDEDYPDRTLIWSNEGDNYNFSPDDEIIKGSRVSYKELKKYIGYDFNTFYGWHITDLKIYDKPKELSEFYKPFKYDGDGVICGTEKEISDIYEWDCETLFAKKYPNFDFKYSECKDCPKAKDFYRLTRPPRSWQFIEIGE